jgi:hypothetical protein
VILGAFKGLKNTVSRERLGQDELERAVNVDIDDVGQLRRRRGYVRKQTGSWHSVRTFTLKVLGVRDGTLGVSTATTTASLARRVRRARKLALHRGQRRHLLLQQRSVRRREGDDTWGRGARPTGRACGFRR